MNRCELRTTNGVKYFAIPAFEAAGGVAAAFSTRIGGVSTGKLTSLNLGLRKPDEPWSNVRENYRRFCGAVGLDAEKAVLTTQEHTDIIIEDAHQLAGNGWNGPPDIVADALITDRSGCALVKLTADCVPVLLYAPDVHAIGAVHDGWRGTAARLAAKTAQRMCGRYGADPKKMLAAIGPSIGPCCFEVDRPVADVFSDGFEPAFTRQVSEQKWHVDLWSCNVQQLSEAGLPEENISVAQLCTKCGDPEMFYSYRREGKGCGSLAAVIGLV